MEDTDEADRQNCLGKPTLEKTKLQVTHIKEGWFVETDA
jgi:hypothetical protein